MKYTITELKKDLKEIGDRYVDTAYKEDEEALIKEAKDEWKEYKNEILDKTKTSSFWTENSIAGDILRTAVKYFIEVMKGISYTEDSGYFDDSSFHAAMSGIKRVLEH